MKRPIISLTSDFGVQSQGVGNMEGVIAQIAPDARVIHLMHGLPDFDIRAGARTMETVQYLPVGYHVCVVDPGVGSNRKAVIIKVKMEDFGPAVSFDQLTKAPYHDAVITDNKIEAEVININKFGSINLNILHKTWDEFAVKLKDWVILDFGTGQVKVSFMETFSQVEGGQPLVLKDDYGRVEAAINMGNFAKKYHIKTGQRCIIKKVGLN